MGLGHEGDNRKEKVGKKLWVPKKNVVVANDGFQMVGRAKSVTKPAPVVIHVLNHFDALVDEAGTNIGTIEADVGCNDESLR